LIGDKNWVIEMKITKKSLWGEGSLMVGASSSAVSIAINPTGIFYFIAFFFKQKTAYEIPLRLVG